MKEDFKNKTSGIEQQAEDMLRARAVEQKETVFEYDHLKMYFGEPYRVTDKIVIYQPTIGDIIEFGEKKFYSTIVTLCANPTAMKLALWDVGIDWTTISDFELFALNIKTLEPDATKLIFGDLDLTKFQAVDKDDGSGFTLVYLPDVDIQIDELVALNIVEYLRVMFNIHPKTEKPHDETTKQWIIQGERMDILVNATKQKSGDGSVLLPLISAALNHPGFKYKKNELKDVGIVEFMDSIKRLNLYENTIALLHGVNSGFVDTSKMKNLDKELNWMRDMYDE